jgi:hypothetical protein
MPEHDDGCGADLFAPFKAGTDQQSADTATLPLDSIAIGASPMILRSE